MEEAYNFSPVPVLDQLPEVPAPAVSTEIAPEPVAAPLVEEDLDNNWWAAAVDIADDAEDAEVAEVAPVDNKWAAPFVPAVAAVVAVVAAVVAAVPNMVVVAVVVPQQIVVEHTNLWVVPDSEWDALTDWASNRQGPTH